ncbi:Tripartite tricarboxylate transport system protein TctC [Pseudomonas syringae pv. apii]|uniref:Tripartite tricarboxylate transport system protein TctC n=1 Tax=Pseudomonas syringae pv. apii TaxID=81036 RepID=A0A3M5WWS1_9PSED|nr:Tripartite tricarboxylate transport system protein TctC [Pseudomonas syringae pv. apii]
MRLNNKNNKSLNGVTPCLRPPRLTSPWSTSRRGLLCTLLPLPASKQHTSANARPCDTALRFHHARDKSACWTASLCQKQQYLWRLNMKFSLRHVAATAGCMLIASQLLAEPKRPECIAPASPGGGFDLTCKLVQSALINEKILTSPMRVTYMPGGVGAVAYNAVVAQRPADAGTLVAWSSGSLLNLAQGKFGRFDENAVRWLAAVGTSYGAIAVKSDSPYKNLDDLVQALKADPSKVVIGSGGTVGSQDWMQTALIAKVAGINPRALRYVALEGGGEIATALLGGHIQVGSTDISDSMPHILSGDMRLLAVFAEKRIDEPEMKDIPTAKEQGYDIVWPVVRGFYLGPKVSDEDYNWWKASFDKILASEDFAKLRDQRELFPFAMSGAELDTYVKKQVADYKVMAKEFGLIQ